MEPVNKWCMAHHRLASLYYVIHTLHSGMWVLPGTKRAAAFSSESFIAVPLSFITSSPEDVGEPLGEPSVTLELSVVPGSLGPLASFSLGPLARPLATWWLDSVSRNVALWRLPVFQEMGPGSPEGASCGPGLVSLVWDNVAPESRSGPLREGQALERLPPLMLTWAWPPPWCFP